MLFDFICIQWFICFASMVGPSGPAVRLRTQLYGYNILLYKIVLLFCSSRSKLRHNNSYWYREWQQVPQSAHSVTTESSRMVFVCCLSLSLPLSWKTAPPCLSCSKRGNPCTSVKHTLQCWAASPDARWCADWNSSRQPGGGCAWDKQLGVWMQMGHWVGTGALDGISWLAKSILCLDTNWNNIIL